MSHLLKVMEEVTVVLEALEEEAVELPKSQVPREVEHENEPVPLQPQGELVVELIVSLKRDVEALTSLLIRQGMVGTSPTTPIVTPSQPNLVKPPPV